MSKVLSETSQWTASVTTPTDGDQVDAASLDAGFQPLTDRSKYMREGIPGRASSYQYRVPLPYPSYNANSRFSWGFPTDGSYGWLMTDVTNIGQLTFQIPVPAVGTITAATFYLWCGTGRAGLPTTMPKARIYDILHTAPSTLTNRYDEQVDTSGSLGAYEQAHTIVITTSNVGAISADSIYAVEFFGEGGTNKLVDKLSLLDVDLTITP